jgi:hypothetical protein
MLTGVEQNKTSLQIFQTDSSRSATLIFFDPMSGIADFHLDLRVGAGHAKPQLQGRRRGFTAVLDGVLHQWLKNDPWNQGFARFSVDLAVDAQVPVKTTFSR